MYFNKRIATAVWVVLISSSSILAAKAHQDPPQPVHNPNWENCQGIFSRPDSWALRYETYVTPDGDVVTIDPTVPSGFRVYRLDPSGRPKTPRGMPISGSVLELPGTRNVWHPLSEGSVGLLTHFGDGSFKRREFKLGSKVSVANVTTFEDTRFVELNSLHQPIVREISRDRGANRQSFFERRTQPFAKEFLGQTDEYFIGRGSITPSVKPSLILFPKEFASDDSVPVVFLNGWGTSHRRKSEWIAEFADTNLYTSMDTRFIVGISRDQQAIWMLWKIKGEDGSIKTQATAEGIQGSLGTDAPKNLHWTRNTLLGISGSVPSNTKGTVGLWKIYLNEGNMSSLRLPEASKKNTQYVLSSETSWVTDQHQNTYFTYFLIEAGQSENSIRNVIGMIGEKGIEVKQVAPPLPANEKVIGLTISGDRKFLVIISRRRDGDKILPALKFRSVSLDAQ